MATLKISDLSVGDWIEVDHEDYGWQPAKINVCGDLGIGVYFKDIDPEEEYDCTLSQARPIPVTPEILEANGFVKNGEYDEWNIGTWKTPYLLGVSLERPAVTIKWNGSSIFIDQAKNVHQLQHALRLAGVNKEVVMPKK